MSKRTRPPAPTPAPDPKPDPTDLIDKRTAAASLKHTVRGLDKLISRGEIPRPFHIGRSCYWRKVTWLQFLAERERGAK